MYGRKSRSSGWGEAILGLIIGLFIIIALLFSAGRGLLIKMGYGEGEPKRQMVAYVQELYPEATEIRAACPKLDSDGDGYVRCTSVFTYKGHEEETLAECTTALQWNSGCAPAKNLTMNSGDQ
jgi:hypothetical protein